MRITLTEVRTNFKLTACSGSATETLKNYFQAHQRFLGLLVDGISARLWSKEETTGPVLRKNLLEHLLTECEALLSFIKNHFPEHMDQKMTLPDQKAYQAREKLKEKIYQISGTAESGDQLSNLAAMMEAALMDVQPVYRSERLWDKILTDLEEITKKKPLNAVQAISFLIMHNFNHQLGTKMIYRIIDEQLHLIPDPEKQLNELMLLEKAVVQASKTSEKKLFPGLPSLGNSITKYIGAEIKLIKQINRLIQRTSISDPFEGCFAFSLSVKQLAYFIYLQVETGVLITRTAKQVHQYFANRFTTFDGTPISEKSFKNAYYSHAPEDIQKVIEKLSQMLALAEENY
ncbi:hypothetical protein [Pedobacter kyonggii]|uniref:Uncharacterized protein n=1 Tax=Pedobacter kyonggii TaxID=1926871 RepID=A0A4Q9HHZ4_9SPHI|nr:hypothetical protein [Pedobacter kyonggii]TBO44310.1 hypothetical protein EYS08_03075 [Pedobacter kyonggii]